MQTLLEVEERALQGFTDEQKEQFFQMLEQIYVNMSQLPSEDIFLNCEKVKKNSEAVINCPWQTR
jgi:hypothetical protein